MTALNEDAEHIPLANEQQEVLAHALRLHLPNQGKAKQNLELRKAEQVARKGKWIEDYL